MQIQPPTSICRCGLARGDITPPVGIYHRMWGAAVHDQSEGVHRPLTATALVFQQVDQKPSRMTEQVLVAIDHCLLGVEEVDAIVNRVTEVTGVSRAAVAISFSHTHAAGLLNLDRQTLPGGHLIPAYLSTLAEQVAELVSQARGNSRPATIQYATGHCSLAAHRDYLDTAVDEWVCGYNPEGTTDDTVLVSKLTDLDGRLLATCVNYACHPTTLAWDNRLISPDYPGAMREMIEQLTQAPCVFLQGASGDLGPVEGYVGDLEVADRNGRQLAFAALEALESLARPRHAYEYAGAVTSGATIGTWRHVPMTAERIAAASNWCLHREAISLPYRDDLPSTSQVAADLNQLHVQERAARDAGDEPGARELRALAERKKRMLGRLQGLPDGDSYPYEISVWRMGDAIWLALPGEPYNLLQRQLRARFPDSPIMIATVANGWGPSYLPIAEAYGKGIYQETIAALAPGSLETLIDTLADRIAKLECFGGQEQFPELGP